MFNMSQKLIDQVAQVPSNHIREYLDESDNQGWDGYSDTEVAIINRFLEDLVLASKHM